MSKAASFLSAKPKEEPRGTPAYQGTQGNKAASFLQKSPLSQNGRTWTPPTFDVKAEPYIQPIKTETKINSVSRGTQESARERYAVRQDEARIAQATKVQKERLQRLRIIEADLPEAQKAQWTQKIAETETALAGIQNRQNQLFYRKQQQKIADYNRVMANPDFLTYADRGKAMANPTWDSAKQGAQLQNKVAFANTYGDYLKRLQASTLGFEESGVLTGSTAELIKYTYMTPAEQNTYAYHLAKEGEKKAQEYLDALDRELDRRRQLDLNEETAAWAREHKVAGVIGNLVSGYVTPGAFFETVRQNVENLNTGEYAPVNAYSPAMMGVHAQNATQEGVTGDIENSRLQFLANTGLSIGQNLVRYPMGGLGLGMMGLGAAGSTATEATLRGATADQALELGVIAGAAEVLTEKLPMDNFFRLLRTGSKGLKGTVMELLKQAGTEASEELVSEYVNRIADNAIMGDLSEMHQYIEELVAAGVSQEEAEKAARNEFYIKQPLLAAWGGALSGGVLGGGALLGSNTVGAYSRGRSLMESGQAEGLVNDAARGRYGPENRAYAENLGQKAEAQGKIPARQVGVLAREAAAYETQVTETAGRLAKAFGRDIALFDQEAENGYIQNGYFKDGTIYINRRSQNPIAQVFAHELTHSLEGTDGYNALQSYVFTQMQQAGIDLDQARLAKGEQYRKAGQTLATEAAVNSELTAEYIEKNLLTNEKEVLRLARENKRVAYRILNWIETTIAKVTGNTEKQQLLQARALYRKALGESGVTAAAAEGTQQYSFSGVTADGTEVYETSEAVKKMPVKARMAAFMDIMREEYKGRTAKFTTEDGTVYYARFDEADLRKNVYGDKRSSPHGWKAKINAGADGNIFELVENAQHKGSAAEQGKAAAAHQNLTGWDYFVKTVQIDGRVYDLLANVRKKPDGAYVYSIQLNENKNKAPAPPRQYQNGKAQGGTSRPVRVPTDASINTIAETGLNVNEEQRKPQFSIGEAADSYGSALTAEQEAYFRDSVVRDERGNLRPVWHGTDVDFNTFEKGDIGFHFGTYEQADARSRESGNQVMMECYLNLKNPLVVETDYGMWDAARIAEKLMESGVISKAEFRRLQRMEGYQESGYDSPGNRALRELLEAKGYDGIQYRNIFEGNGEDDSYIVFHPNQIKLVNNLTPTRDADTRYSLSEYEENEEMLALIRKWFGEGDSQATFNEAQRVYQKAEKAQAQLDRILEETAEELGIAFEPAPQKSVESMVNKVQRKAAVGNAYDLYRMKDHARGKLELNDFTQIPRVLSILEQKNIPGPGRSPGAERSESDFAKQNPDQFQTEAVGPTEWGYRGFHVTYRNGEGISSEIQLSRPDVWQVKLESDRIYEKWRNVTSFETLSDEEYTAYLTDKERSINMWTQLGLPDFSIYESNSSSDSTRALKSSSADTGRSGLRQTPSISSSTLTFGSGENSNMRPDSVIQAMQSAPFDSSIAQKGGDNNAAGVKTGVKTIQELVAKYGAIPPGENPVREVSVPQKTAADQVVSRFARTLAESGVLPAQMLGEVERLILDGKMSHEVITDKKAESYARNTIETQGWDDALMQWKAVANGIRPAGKHDIALGQMLFNQACQARDVKAAKQLAVELAVEATRAGQAVQAQRLLKKLTPDGQLYALEKSAQRINQQTLEQYREYSEKHPQVEIEEGLALRLLEAKTQEEINAAVEAIQQNIADQMPATGMEKWNGWRYLSMLGNVRTHVRNIVGNAIFVPAVELKNLIGAGLEKAVVPQSERTKTILNPGKDRALLQTAKSDWAAMAPYVQSGGKYSETDGIQEKRRIFKNQIVEGLRQLNFKALEAEDAVFLRRAYINSFAQMARARGYTPQFLQSGTQEAQQALSALRNYATLEARKATYRDANATAQALNKLKQSGLAGQLIGEGILPFTKTPANILRRGMEYSPVGLLQGIGELARVRKTGNAAVAIDKLSAGMSGTMMLVLGAFLAHLGLLSGGDDEDEREQIMDKLTGGQTYALNLGDRSYTLDWAAPMSMPLFVGVELYKQLEQGFDNLTFRSILDSLTGITEPVFEMSMLSGIQDSISAAKFSESPVTEVAAQAVASYFSQAIPTLFGQVARSTDDTRRRTYLDKNSPLPDLAQSFLQKGAAKIPGLNQTLQPYVDQWGRTEENAGVIGNMLSPGFYSQRNETPVDKEVLRLYRETGNGGVVPGYADKYILYKGERKDLTAEEYTQYATEKGRLSYALVEEALDSWKYKRLSDEDKAELVAKLYGYSNAMAKTSVSKGPEEAGAEAWPTTARSDALTVHPDGQNAKAAEAQKRYGISPVDYFAIYLAVNGIKGDGTALSASKNKKTAIDKMTGGFSKRQKEYLYEVFGVSEKVW